jgi:hypothetical protein
VSANHNDLKMAAHSKEIALSIGCSATDWLSSLLALTFSVMSVFCILDVTFLTNMPLTLLIGQAKKEVFPSFSDQSFLENIS